MPANEEETIDRPPVMDRWTARQQMIDAGATEAEATCVYGSPDWVDPDPELSELDPAPRAPGTASDAAGAGS